MWERPTRGAVALRRHRSGILVECGIRILNSAAPEVNGDFVQAEVGIDNVTAVPEPGTWLLLAIGAAALTVGLRRGRDGAA